MAIENILLIGGIVGGVVAILSIVLINLLPSKSPIGPLIIVIIHWVLLVSCMFMALMYLSFKNNNNFFARFSFDKYLVNFIVLIVVPSVIYGTLSGIVAYVGARFLRWGNKGCIPFFLVVGLILMLLNCILMTLGYVGIIFAAGMLQG
jgi:hypothetical protein